MRKAAIALLAFAMVAAPMLVAGADDEKGKGKPRSLLEANKADKAQEADAAQHGGWGGYGGGHGSGHWDTVPHGDHHHHVWHDTSHGGWGRKLMSAENTEEAESSQHWGGYRGYGGYGGHHGGYDGGYHHHHHGGWGRKLMAADSVDKAQETDAAQHGGWGHDDGHGSGHWDYVPHGNHHDMVWHDTSYGGWGRKLSQEDDD